MFNTKSYTKSELYIALLESLRFQKHYAELLNMYDGGKRQTEALDSPQKWVSRLRETGIYDIEKQGE